MLKFDKLIDHDTKQREYAIAKESNKDTPIPEFDTVGIVKEWNDTFLPAQTAVEHASIAEKLKLAGDLIASAIADEERLKETYAEDSRRIASMAKYNKTIGLTASLIETKEVMSDFTYKGKNVRNIADILRLIVNAKIGEGYDYVADVKQINKTK